MADVNYERLISKRLAESGLDLAGRIEALRLLDDATASLQNGDASRSVRAPTVFAVAAEFDRQTVARAEAEFRVDAAIDHVTERVRAEQQEKGPEQHASGQQQSAEHGPDLWCENGCQPLAGLCECGMCGYVGDGVPLDKTRFAIEADEETGTYRRGAREEQDGHWSSIEEDDDVFFIDGSSNPHDHDDGLEL